jgi:hypothetical protein
MQYKLKDVKGFKADVYDAYEILRRFPSLLTGIEIVQNGNHYIASNSVNSLHLISKEMKYFVPLITCKAHPSYKVLKAPKADCEACRALYYGMIKFN